MTTTFPHARNIDRRQVFHLVVPAKALRKCKWHDHAHLFRDGVQTGSNGMVRLEDLARNARSVADLIYPLWIAEFPKGVADAFAHKRYDLSHGRGGLCHWLAECAYRQSYNVALPYYRRGSWDDRYTYGVSDILDAVHEYGRLGLSRASMAGQGHDLTEPRGVNKGFNEEQLEQAEKFWRQRGLHPSRLTNVELDVEFQIQHWDLVENAFRVFPAFLLAFQVAMVIWEDVPPEELYKWIEAYKMPYEIHFPRTGGLFSGQDEAWPTYPNTAQHSSRYLY